MRLVALMFRVVIVLTLTYIFSFGTNFSGVILPDLRFFNLVLLTIAVVIWGVAHWRGQWQWGRSPLDFVFVLWLVVIAVSILANQDSWRRSMIAVWYVVLYLLLWYMVSDAFTNRGLSRETLIDGFMFAGLVVIGFGFIELSTKTFDLTALQFPRPGSLIGNPNSLGAFLIVAIGFAGGRLVSVQNRVARVILSFYILAASVLLLLTFSRGAWIGGVGTLFTLMILWLRSTRRLSRAGLVTWWNNLRRNQRFALMGATILLIGVGLLMSLAFIQSLSTSGRGVDLRTRIWEDAVIMFSEKPLTGHGLFNFGREFERLESMPPNQPHSHAHNVLLLVAAEMGIAGLIVMGLTVFVALRLIDTNWQNTPLRERSAFTGGYAAVLGFGVHHLLDTPFMMPLIALSGLLALAVCAIPINAVPVQNRMRHYSQSIVLAGSALGLMMIGFWSVSVSQRYMDALSLINRNEYYGAAQVMQGAIDADPNLAVYHEQQAYLYGVIADEGNSDALSQALSGYERFLELEPQSAVGLANYAALLWQAGETDEAITAMQTAVDGAPLSWPLALNLGAYLEADGQDSRAREVYEDVVDFRNVLLPFWDETPLRQEIASTVEVSELDRYLLGEEAVTFESLDLRGNSVKVEFARLLHLLRTDAPEAQIADQVESIETALPTSNSSAQVWLDMAHAEVLRANDDFDGAEAWLITARDRLVFDVVNSDFVYGANIGNFQFLRFVVPRRFLPQVYYPTVDPLILHWLEG